MVVARGNGLTMHSARRVVIGCLVGRIWPQIFLVDRAGLVEYVPILLLENGRAVFGLPQIVSVYSVGLDVPSDCQQAEPNAAQLITSCQNEVASGGR